MARLTYWVCNCLNDSKVYSFRARTRKECVKWWTGFDGDVFNPEQCEFRQENYSKPVKVTVEYRDALDLLQQCLSEGGIREDNE